MKNWKPTQKDIEQTHIYKNMHDLSLNTYSDFWKWSVENKALFWKKTIENLHIPFFNKPKKILENSNEPILVKWLIGAKMNIVDACFQNHPNTTAIIYKKEEGEIIKITQKELLELVNKIANSLGTYGLKKGDRIAIDMPMTLEAIAIYLAGIKAGIVVATIADSFTANEIGVRLEITKPKLVFTQDIQLRAGKTLPLYEKVVKANPKKIIVIKISKKEIPLRSQDLFWDDFLSENSIFQTIACKPQDTMTILFSSGTTGTPKAIPWTHVTPIKSASDGYYHQDIHTGDVVTWPTNLGWMMGPWLVFAALINRASIALYYGAPLGKEFGEFIQNSKTTMLGLVPSIVKNWRNTQCMEGLDWSAIKCFSSTGEASNPEEYSYLMGLANNKPIIEYCGGTEIGGGYVTSTLVQENIPSTFSTQALGGNFVLLDGNNNLTNKGEVFLVPPILGLSETLLNKDHYEVYYKNTPTYNKQILRRHGDQMQQMKNGYYKAQGRVDDAMNLGGIKVSSLQIESVINTLDCIKESAAIAVAPKDGGPDKLIIYYVEKTSCNKNDILKDLQQLVKKRINPLFKVSDAIPIKELPRTASGKVMRRHLRKQYIHQ